MSKRRWVGAAVCRRSLVGALLLAISMVAMGTAWAQYPSAPQITKDGTAIVLRDYASLPLSSVTTSIDLQGQLGRVNFLRSEPTNAPQSSFRFFVNDLNGNLYTLDKANKSFTSYINFAMVFPKFDSYPGYAGGLVTFVFDPDYAFNGKFYTVHTEDPAMSGSALPTNANLPGLNLSGGYTTSSTVAPPTGTIAREAVLIEWVDTNLNDSTFEGTAREILRVGFDGIIHPMGDLLFNPLAFPGHSDFGNLYIAVGDGSAGEMAGATHAIPQRLDAIQGKILRITPDINRNPLDPLSANGRYRIPATGSDPNPFVSVSGAKGEIYAYGFRNPHRLSWDPVFNSLIVNEIGLHSWEEVNIVTRGANYGYAEREGIEQLFVGGVSNGKTGSQTNPPTAFPSSDLLTVAGVASPVTPVYPVAAYSHRDGDGISSGFVYRGASIPQLYGKYVFGDITTGRLFYADLTEMISSNDGIRTTLATVHELQVIYNSPYDIPDRGAVYRRLYDIVADAFVQKGGRPNAPNVLPGVAPNVGSGMPDPYGVPYGGGRADIRLAVGSDNEIYILSKSDGMIRELKAADSTAIVATPAISPVAGSYPSPLTVTITDTTPGAAIYYTTNGTTPTVTPSQSYGGPFTLSASATVNAIAVAGGYSNSAIASAGYTVIPGASCLLSSSSSWQNRGIATQGVPFQASFDATPNLANMNGVIGLSLGSADIYTTLAAIVRFNPAGVIDARNGGVYAADATVPYSPGLSYHFRLQISPAAHVYTIFVTPPGSAEITLGTNFAFRTEQSGVSSLNNWAIYSETGSHTVCNFAVAAVGMPAPVVSGLNPASGTQGQTLNVVIAGSNFQNGAVCSFGSGISVVSCAFNTAAQLTANISITGSAASGPRGITVTNPDGKTASLSNGFTVNLSPPSQTATPAISPVAGSYPSPLTVTITDATPGATIYYTTNGTTPTVTPSQSYSGPFTLSASATVNAIAVAGGYSNSAIASAVYTVIPGASCLQSPFSSWQNTGIGTQGVPFQASFDATPNLANMNGVIGLSLGSAYASTTLAAIVRFNSGGVIDARNGGSYVADATVPYSPGLSYHFRLQISPAAHVYTVFVTPPGSAEITLGTNFAFRTEQSEISSLNNWAIYSETGSHTVCNFAVAAVSLPAPVVSAVNPGSGTQGQTLNVVIAGSNFQNGAVCSFGSGISIISCAFNTAAQLTANISITGSAATGPRGITVTNPDGKIAGLSNGFTVNLSPPPQTATPAISPVAGSYPSPLTVTITDITPGATIYYTTNGTTPTVTPAQSYSGPFTLSASATVNAIAVASGYSNSAIASAIYTVSLPAPVVSALNPASGTQGQTLNVVIAGSNFQNGAVCSFGSGISVISCAFNTAAQLTANISITGSAATGPRGITVTNPDGKTASLSNAFTVNLSPPPQTATPAISPVAGSYPSPLTVTIADITPGATIYYTTNGTTPTVTPSQSYSGPFILSASATVNAIAVAGGYSSSAIASAAYTVTPGASCLQSPFSSWQNTGIGTQGVPFQASFDATPNLANMNGVIGLSLGSAYASTTLAAIVRFNPAGVIDARNGGSYAADATVPYSPGLSYHFRLQISPAAHVYTVFVTPPGSAEFTLGTNFAFRTEQSGISSLNNWAIYSETGSHTVCNFAVAAVSLPAPLVSAVNPASGTQGQTLNVVIAGSNFQNGAVCSFGSGISIISCAFNTAAQLTANISITGSAASGPRGITVTNPDGKTASLSNGFTVNLSPPPQTATPAISPVAGSYPSPLTVTITDTTPGATIYYTTNGTTPTVTPSQSYSGPFTLSASATVNAIAVAGGYSNSAIASAVYTVIPVASCLQSSSSSWQNSGIGTQGVPFQASFDATPNLANMDGVTGLSLGSADAYTTLAAIVRFNPAGVIDARNGGGYAADATIPYSPGLSYHFRLQISPAAHVYTIFVTPPGSAEITLGTNFAFRTEQSGISSLNNWAIYPQNGSHTVCNFAVQR